MKKCALTTMVLLMFFLISGTVFCDDSQPPAAGSKENRDKKKPDDNKPPEDKIIIRKINIGGDSNNNNERKNEERQNYDRGTDLETTYGYWPEYYNPADDYIYDTDSFSNLNLSFKLAFSAKYSLLGTYFTSFLESKYFKGQWNGNMLFSGYGGEASLSIMGLSGKNFGIEFSLGYFEHKNTTNSYSDAVYAITETSELKLAVFKMELIDYPLEPFYIRGGLGVYGYSIDTNVTTNMPGYTYTGLTGENLDIGLVVGCGVDIKILNGFSFNAGIEGAIFSHPEDDTRWLRDSFMPNVGASWAW